MSPTRFTQESSDAAASVDQIDQNPMNSRNSTITALPAAPLNQEDINNQAHGDPELDALLAGEAMPEVVVGAANTFVELRYRVPYTEADHRGLLAATSLPTLLPTRQRFFLNSLNLRRNRVPRDFFNASMNYYYDQQMLMPDATTSFRIFVRQNDITNGIERMTISNEEMMRRVEEQHRSCSICTENFVSGELASQLRSCHHRFHTACLEPWLRLHQTCPTCPATIRPNTLVEPQYGEEAIRALIAGEPFPGITQDGNSDGVIVMVHRLFEFSEADHRGLSAAIAFRNLPPLRQRVYMQAFLQNPNPIPRNTLLATMRFMQRVWPMREPDGYTSIGISGAGPVPTPTSPKGMSKKEIKAIPRVTINGNEAEGQKTCSVCVEDFVIRENVFKLSCRHLFHQKCLKPWLMINRTCPSCRQTHNPTTIPYNSRK